MIYTANMAINENKQIYEKQMISVDISLFTRKDNTLMVLLARRNEEPFKNHWSLIGGGVYNTESCEQAIIRESHEKIGLTDIKPILTGVSSEPNRDPRFRNISVYYLGVIEAHNALNLNPQKITEVALFPLSAIPLMAFDHKDILQKTLIQLQSKIYDIDFIKSFAPDNFTLANLQIFYESILQQKLDKRNFRRKLASLDCLIKTGEKNTSDPHKKSELYKFK